MRGSARRDSDPVQGDLYGRDEDVPVLQAVAACADDLGVPPAQVALAWLLQKPAVTAPIVGATKIGHVEDALAAAELTLGSEQVALLEQAYRPQPLATGRARLGDGCDEARRSRAEWPWSWSGSPRPCCGRSTTGRSRRGGPTRVLDDPKAVELVERIDYPFGERFGSGEGFSQWQALRARCFDLAVARFLAQHPDGSVVALGEGLETQFWRVDNGRVRWLTVDLPEVVELRQAAPSRRRLGCARSDARRWTRAGTTRSTTRRVCS